MANQEEKHSTNRRALLKGFGGGLAIPAVAGRATAEQVTDELSVSVEAGEGGADNWTPRARVTDEFKARIDVSGISGRTIAVMVVVRDPNDEFIEPATDVYQPDWPSGFIVSQKTWNTVSILDNWTAGSYHLYAAVVDSDGAFGVGVSDSFEVNPP